MILGGKMKKKKLILLPLTLLVVSLTSCGGESSSGSSASSASSSVVSVTEPSSGNPSVSSGVSSAVSSDASGASSVSVSSVIEETHRWDDDGVLKILEVGNSFGEDTFGYATKILSDLGVEHYVIGKLYYGGCTLDQHYDFMNKDTLESGSYEFRYIDETSDGWTLQKSTSLMYGLQFDEWDFISLQQSSGSSGKADSYGHLDDIIEFIEQNNAYAHSEFVWNMTWTYPQDGGAGELAYYENSPEVMYAAIVDTVQSVIMPNEKFAKVLVPGTAIQNASMSYIKNKLHRDDRHLSYIHGRFIAGLTYFCDLIDRDVDLVSYTPINMTDSDRAVCIESVKNALENRFEKTDSVYLSDPEVRFTGVDRDVILEAEDGVIDGKGAKTAGCENASGGKIACDFNNCGQGLYFNYFAPVGGDHELEIAYWTGAANSKQDLYVNGTRQQTIVYEQETGWANGFNDAALAHTTIRLEEGYNTINIIKYGTSSDTSSYGGYVQLDYLIVKGTGETYDAAQLDLTVTSMRIEAELGYFHTSTAAPVAIGSAGNGYVVGEINKEGDGADFAFLVPEDGQYELHIVYGKGAGANPIDIRLNNDASITYALEDYPNQAWNVFYESATAATLTLSSKKVNKLSVTRSAEGKWFCFDAIVLVKVA